ncbi:MAG TPA: branched-chain amino acid ABC transporter permease [Dehalococcoidia bacterium]|nr:branched-chain amino acid ABC transporter permease [Dehalococcoidia bacterium]
MKNRKITSRALLWSGIVLVVLAVLATLPVYTPDYTVILITGILMYVILTVSWALFSGPTGYLSLATAAFFGIGIYTAATLGKALPLPLVIIIGALVSFCLGLIVGALTLRLRGVYFTIFTLGLVEMIKQLLLWYEVNITHTRGRFVVVVDNTTIYYMILIVFVLLIVTAFIIRRSKYGMALRSIGENEEAASHIGINTTNVKIITFAISAIFMGAAGAIMATKWTYIDPYIAFNPLFSFTPVLMAIFGGIGQLYGLVAGAAIFAYLEEILITQFPYYYMLIFGIILVVVILFLPRGIADLFENWRKGGIRKKHADA